MLEALAVPPIVLDVFCGSGRIKDAVYPDCEYLGLDQKQFGDSRATIVCDNERFLRNERLDLARFNVFDLDAYGSAGYQLAIICKRLWPLKQKTGIAFTDGQGFASHVNSMSGGLLSYLELKRVRGSTWQKDERENILRMLIKKTAADAHASVTNLTVARKSGSCGVLYLSYLLEPIP